MYHHLGDDMEIWKDIKDYEEQYEVSSYGRIRNKRTQQILKGDKNSLGYCRVTLYSPIKKRFFVHRLVAYHFVDGYSEELVVNHKDGNKQNNNVENLEWVTKSENDLHAYKLGLRKANPSQYRKKIESFDLITNQKIKDYRNVDECVKDLGIARSNIYNCCNGKQLSCKGVGLRYI